MPGFTSERQKEWLKNNKPDVYAELSAQTNPHARLPVKAAPQPPSKRPRKNPTGHGPIPKK